MFGFAGAILAGTALLLLPFSAADGRSTGIVDALFTATSAVCVTGLTVLDTATHWSGFGLAVIMLLIQLGGLGIMIFASLVGLLIARRFSMRARMTAAVEARALSTRDVKGLVRGIVLMSLTIEAVVFAFLFRFCSSTTTESGRQPGTPFSTRSHRSTTPDSPSTVTI